MTLERFGLRVGPAISPALGARRGIRCRLDRRPCAELARPTARCASSGTGSLELLDETARASQNQPRALPPVAVAGTPFSRSVIERSPVTPPVS
jgi:hypothetical protein